MLGVPVGSAAFVRSQLLQSRAGHDRLLERLPALGDLQASWLLLLFCCSPRCNYLLRMLAPATTAEYAQDHDSAVLSALSTLLGTGDLPRHARDVAQLPLSLGGLGLASAVRNSVPAFWASWADCLAVLSRRLPRVAQEFLDHLDSPDPQPACFAAAAAARAALGHSDWAPPAWRELSAGESAPVVQEEGGRAKLQPPRPVGIVRPCWQAPILLPKRSCTPNPGLSLAVSSLQCQSHQFCPIPAISSVFSCCAACASPCLLLSAPAGAVAFWTPSATIVQPAPGQVCSGGAGVRWSVRPHAFAEKLEPESPPTHALRT